MELVVFFKSYNPYIIRYSFIIIKSDGFQRKYKTVNNISSYLSFIIIREFKNNTYTFVILLSLQAYFYCGTCRSTIYEVDFEHKCYMFEIFCINKLK
jgi:hypothetical protein